MVDGPLRRIACIHVATTALAIAAITGLLWFGLLGTQGPFANAVILAVVLAASGGALVLTLRLVRRELSDRQQVDRALHDSESVLQQVAQDVTEARAAQRELARQRDALENANRELARSNAELEQFASVASHDLQEPLRKLVAFSELLQHDAGSQLPERAHQDLEFITDAARRMRTLVRDLLTLLRTGTSEMKVIPVSLDGCADRALEALDLRISESAAVVTRDPLPIVMGDLTLLDGLYQNLLSNALKFTAPGHSPRIHLSAVRDGDGSWVLGIRDAGIGVDPRHAEEIFRPFRRLHAPEKYPGTGIGLAIASKAVDRHGGRLWLDPAGPAGEPGSHFRFTLEGAKCEK